MFKMPLFGKTVLAGVFLLSLAGPGLAQVNRSLSMVKGIVVDAETNEPIAAASVALKGTTNKVQTSFNGEFALNVPLPSTLQVGAAGYKTVEVAGRSNEKMRISLPLAGEIGN